MKTDHERKALAGFDCIEGVLGRRAVLLGLVLLLTMVRQVFAQVDLIRNPGFAQTGGNLPNGWASWSHDPGTVTFTVDNENRRNGRSSLKVTSTSDKDWSVPQDVVVIARPGDVFRLSGWVRCSGATQGSLSLHTADSRGNTLNWVAALVTTGDADWHHLARNFIVPPGCATIQYRFTGSGRGTAWLAEPGLIRVGKVSDPAPQPVGDNAGDFPTSPSGYDLHRTDDLVTVSTAHLRLDCDLRSGLWNVHWPGGTSLTSMSCATKLSTGDDLRATGYSKHFCSDTDITNIADAFGNGVQVTVHHRQPDKPELRQQFRIYAGISYCFVRLEVVGTTPVSSNDMSPVVSDESTAGTGAHLDAGSWLRTLCLPLDNAPCSSACATWSDEVTAIFDNRSRHAIVLGSVTHDVWKTGITMDNPRPGAIGYLRVYGGATFSGGLTGYDNYPQPHGFVSGNVIASPLVFIGSFSDWRDGMETFGRANALLHPALKWDQGVPVGWNSWSAYETSPDFDHFVAVADYFKTSLQPRGFGNNGIVYIGLDGGFWRLSDEQLKEAAGHVHANGQRAGILLTPFATWDPLDYVVQTPVGQFTGRDMTMKDSAGQPIKIDGTYALDPTHPGTLACIDQSIRKFLDDGFDLIKVDWLLHGTLEGKHYDPGITTGMAAFDYGMKRVMADLDPGKTGRRVYLSLATSPRFMSGYGHSRPVMSDSNFGTIESTQNMLEGLTYGWWQAGTMYPYNDADLINVYRCRNHPFVSAAEARTRVNATVIAGSPLLNSDDLTDPKARQRAEKWLANPDIIALGCSGRSFRPVEGDTDDTAADVFVRDDNQEGKFYVAVFNYSRTEMAHKHLDLARLGLDGAKTYARRDLWTGEVTDAQGSLYVELAPCESTVFRLTSP